MYSQASPPKRYNSNVSDYSTSGFSTGRHFNSSSSLRTDTDLNDSNFHFDFDAISQSSNDILATVDEGLRLEVDNVSVMYNNAADANSNNKATIFAGAAGESRHKIPSKKRLVFVLLPALALEFGRVFSGLFMLLNLDSFFGYDIEGVSLLISGVFGVFVIHIIAVKLRALKSTTEDIDAKMNTLVKYFFSYQIVFIISIALTMGLIWRIVDLENKIKVSTLNSTTNVPSDDWLIVSEVPPIVFSVLLMIGYTLVTSTTGSGQYALLSFMSHFDSNVSPQTASSVIIVWSAIGGILAGFVGIFDSVSNWCPEDDCYDHVTANAAILSSIALILAFICFVTSISAIYWESIFQLWERVLLYCKTHFFIDPNHKESQDKLRDKTAQEEFDECAPLLEASGHSILSSHFTGSQNALLDADGTNTTSTVVTANVKMYAHQIPIPVPTLKRMLARKKFVSVIFLILFLSCLSVIFQYYTPQYLANNVFKYEGGTHTNKSSSSTEYNGADNINNKSVQSIEINNRKVTGLKLTCAGTFVYNLIFLVLYVKRKWISNAINQRLKPWSCPVILLVMSIFSVTLVATETGVVFLVIAFLFGAVRLAEVEMLHTIARRMDRSWPLVEHDITSTPTSFIWSLASMSMVMSSLVVTPLTLSSGNTHVPMVCVTVLAIVLFLGFGISRVNVL